MPHLRNHDVICFTVSMNTTHEEALVTATADEAAAHTHWKTERERLLSELREVDAALVSARQAKRNEIIAARSNGMPVARISRLANITRQRVYQIIRDN